LSRNKYISNYTIIYFRSRSILIWVTPGRISTNSSCYTARSHSNRRSSIVAFPQNPRMANPGVESARIFRIGSSKLRKYFVPLCENYPYPS